MKHWLFYLGVPFPPVTGETKDVYETVLSELEVADYLGYTGAWFAEHHSTPNYATFASPLVFVAAAAQRTKSLRLGTACIVLPLHNPVRVAEEIGMVDALSGGRLEVGLCRGSHRFEYERLGVDFESSEETYRKGLEVVAGHLNGTHPNVSGPAHPPRGTQSPHPPLWSSSGSRRSVASALDNGMQVMIAAGSRGREGLKETRTMFEEECEKRNLDPKHQRFALFVQSAVANSPAEVQSALEFASFLNVVAVRRMSVAGVDSMVTSEDMAFTLPREGWLGANLVGTGDYIRDQVGFFEQLGVTDVILQPNRLGQSPDQLKAQIREYARVVGVTPSETTSEAVQRAEVR